MLKAIIEKNRIAIAKQNKSLADAEKIAFKLKVDTLKPTFEKIKAGLAELPFEVKLHVTGDSPCPAIHVSSRNEDPCISDKIGIIGLRSDGIKYFSGSCTRHVYEHKNELCLIEFIGDAVATSLEIHP
jgi:hypothetical protein